MKKFDYNNLKILLNWKQENIFYEIYIIIDRLCISLFLTQIFLVPQ